MQSNTFFFLTQMGRVRDSCHLLLELESTVTAGASATAQAPAMVLHKPWSRERFLLKPSSFPVPLPSSPSGRTQVLLMIRESSSPLERKRSPRRRKRRRRKRRTRRIKGKMMARSNKERLTTILQRSTYVCSKRWQKEKTKNTENVKRERSFYIPHLPIQVPDRTEFVLYAWT